MSDKHRNYTYGQKLPPLNQSDNVNKLNATSNSEMPKAPSKTGNSSISAHTNAANIMPPAPPPKKDLVTLPILSKQPPPSRRVIRPRIIEDEKDNLELDSSDNFYKNKIKPIFKIYNAGYGNRYVKEYNELDGPTQKIYRNIAYDIPTISNFDFIKATAVKLVDLNNDFDKYKEYYQTKKPNELLIHPYDLANLYLKDFPNQQDELHNLQYLMVPNDLKPPLPSQRSANAPSRPGRTFKSGGKFGGKKTKKRAYKKRRTQKRRKQKKC